MKTRNLKTTTKAALVLSATLGLGGCSLDVPDLNFPSESVIIDQPTRPGVIAEATGLLVGTRVGVSSENGYVALLGVLGREAYVLDNADPRYVSEMLAGVSLDPGSPAFGGNFWTGPYANIHNAYSLLHTLDNIGGVDQGGLSDTEKEACRGFAQTMQALDFLVIINTRDSNGAPIDVDRSPTGPLAPLVSKDEVLAHIVSLLDESRAHLLAGGTAFPFPLSNGFAGFNSVPDFIKFNRALKARVDVYRKDWSTALTDLDMSFLAPTGSLDLGVYYTFGTGSGDTPNTLNNPNIYAHPSVTADADKQADGSLDARVLRKVKSASAPFTYKGVTATEVFTFYPSATSPIPIIRNEELVLLRAEAELHTAGKLADAVSDINLIRTRSGNLPARTDLTDANVLDELLKQRRYSLLFEGGHRWIDARRNDRLEQLPKDKNVPNASVHPNFPLPVAETDARK